jgi:hypothetical protein
MKMAPFNFNTEASLPQPQGTKVLLKDSLKIPQQRSGAWHPPKNWDFEGIEYRGFMLATLFLVPLLRYTQDSPEDKNALLARDFAALGSATMLYLFVRKVLSNGVTRLSKPDVIAKLPKALQGIGKAIGADAKKEFGTDAEKAAAKEKNHFFSYIPAQILSLTASALIGPAIGIQAMKHLKQVHQWMQSPDKVQNLKEGWDEQTPQDKKRHTLEALVTAGGFLGLRRLAYKLMRPCPKITASTFKERMIQRGIRLMDYDLQAIVTSLLGGIALAKLSSMLLFPQSKKEKALEKKHHRVEYPEDHSLKGELKHAFFQAKRDENGELSFKLKAPAVGVALMGATYMTAALGGLAYTVKHHNNPEKLEKLYSYKSAYHALHWLLPSLIIPTMRYSRDPKDKRDELYIRDFTHSWMGMVVYWVAKLSSLKAIEHFNWVALPKAVQDTAEAKRIKEEATLLLASTAGLTAQIASNVLMAPKFSHDFVNYVNTPNKSQTAQSDTIS